MKILLTNDDGIASPGLQQLKTQLNRSCDVWVVAPEGNRSASSHSIHLNHPTRIRQIGEQEFSCDGTPADCIILALMGFVPVSIDLVISGINLGPNLGTDIVYSGTAAAARQAALMNTPGVACSLNSFSEPYHLEYPVTFIEENSALFASLWDGCHFLNINFPNAAEAGKPYVSFPTRRIYNDELYRFQAPNGDLYCYIGGPIPESVTEQGSDYWAIDRGYVSLSPILVHPANHEIETRYQDAKFR